MVALTFPDGARREYPDNITGLDIAKGISPSLAKRTVAMALDGGSPTSPIRSSRTPRSSSSRARTRARSN
jgi:hypothetical protein